MSPKRTTLRARASRLTLTKPPTERTLADHSDGDQTLAQASVGPFLGSLAVASQLQLAGVPGGASNRGADEHLARVRTVSSPEGASPPLGPHTDFPETAPRRGELSQPSPIAARRAAAGQRKQRPVDATAMELAPTLDEWARLDVAYGLLAGGAYDRQAKCQRTRRIARDADVTAVRFPTGAYQINGLVQCGVMHCPHCGTRRSRATSAGLGVVMARHHAASPDHDTWMLTLAPPHHLDDDPTVAADRLYAAKEIFWASRAWTRFAKRWGLVGRVTVLDATHGGREGMHLHFHTALFPTVATVDRQWLALDRAASSRVAREPMEPQQKYPDPSLTPEERRAWIDAERPRAAKRWAKYHAKVAELDAARAAAPAELRDVWETVGETSLRSQAPKARAAWLRELRGGLIPAWEAACLEAGIPLDDLTAFRKHSLDLAPSEKAAAYFTKWGLADEVGAPTAKIRSHLRLLDACKAGVSSAGDAYLAFRAATDGKAWVIGLAKVKEHYQVTDDDCAEHMAKLREARDAERIKNGEELPPPMRELAFAIAPHLYEGVLAVGWRTVLDEVDRLADELLLDDKAIQSELDSYLYTARITRGSPPAKKFSG